MQRNRTALVVLLLLAALLCVSLLTACTAEFKAIDTAEVEKITVWSITTGADEERELNADESARFIELYNASKFEGDDKTGDSTPNFGVKVYFSNGTVMSVLDYHFTGMDFEVYLLGADGKTTDWYYISSDKLHTFVKSLAAATNSPDAE